MLGISALGERLAWPSYLGLVLAVIGVVLLSTGTARDDGRSGWLWLALLSLALQGVGAFVAKLVVTPAGPSALLLTSAGVQVLVGLVLAPPTRWSRSDLQGRATLLTVVAYAAAGAATIAYLLALAAGPAAVVVPLVATSPALAGLLGILHERTSTRQVMGIAAALGGAALLAAAG